MNIVVDAILFDLDGTLADSTRCVDRSWRKLADRLGIDFAEMNGSYHGVPAKQTLARLMPDSSQSEIDEVAVWLAGVEISDTDDIIPIPGALAILDALPSSRWAVVTSGSTALATARITAAGLPLPRHLISADDVSVGKPAPDPYLLAAKTLGYEPKRCLVVEDAPAGVASGLASGAMVLGLRTTHPDLGVPTIADLTALSVSVDRLGIAIDLDGKK